MLNLAISLIKDAEIDEALGVLDDGTLATANMVAGEQMRTFMSRWYDEKGRKHWINPDLPTHGAGRRETQWFSNVARKWFLRDADEKGFDLVFPDEDGSFTHKVNGGKIIAKNAKALTIPLKPEAHGLRAADYERETSRQLFTIKNRSALFESRDGGVRAVYALRKSVTHQPWPNALPNEEELAKTLTEHMLQAIIDLIE